MNTNARFETVRAAVSRLDLTPIMVKLMHEASGEGWSLDKTRAIEQEYRRFLCLMVSYPDEVIAPLADVDTFWHYHILDTMKYALDCEQAFGYFVHHYPYLGIGDADEEQRRLDSEERTRNLYESLFGDAYPLGAAQTQSGATDTVASAWCAGPAAREGAVMTYCAGPGAKMLHPARTTGSAWCAGPAVTMLRKPGADAGDASASPAPRMWHGNPANQDGAHAA